jgi:hypothetical protein
MSTNKVISGAKGATIESAGIDRRIKREYEFSLAINEFLSRTK